VTTLPAHLDQRGLHPDHTAEHLLTLIRTAITEHPRSQQTLIGPSELGHPCARRIGYKLLGQPEREGEPNWKATVGTALHSWLEQVLDGANIDYEQRTKSGEERFYTEQRVTVGQVNGVDIDGSCDVYDRATATVIDWKSVGPTQLTKYKRFGPGTQYRAQAHLYGRGWQAKGLPVDTVMIVFLPRNGELAETYVWHENYDEQVALNALQRASGIALAAKALGPTVLEQLPTADAFCHMCPYYKAQSHDLSLGCPGDPGSTAGKPIDNSGPAFGAVTNTQGVLV
jgi:hypothetical protein